MNFFRDVKYFRYSKWITEERIGIIFPILCIESPPFFFCRTLWDLFKAWKHNDELLTNTTDEYLQERCTPLDICDLIKSHLLYVANIIIPLENTNFEIPRNNKFFLLSKVLSNFNLYTNHPHFFILEKTCMKNNTTFHIIFNVHVAAHENENAWYS